MSETPWAFVAGCFGLFCGSEFAAFKLHLNLMSLTEPVNSLQPSYISIKLDILTWVALCVSSSYGGLIIHLLSMIIRLGINPKMVHRWERTPNILKNNDFITF